MQYLSVNDLHKQGSKSQAPIWVINTADKSRVGTAGEIVIPIAQPNGQGNPDLVHVPQTWLPQEVTRIIPRKRLLGSTSFMRALNDGLISLISEEDAARLMRQSGATEEKSRLLALQEHVKNAGAARTVSDGMKAANGSIVLADGSTDDDEEDERTGRNKTVVIDSNEKASVAELAANGVEDDEPGISPQFKMWAERLNMGTDIAAKNAIKSKSSFKKLELAFLARVLKPEFEQSRKMVKANLK